MPIALIFITGVWAGGQNALAGGGSFVSLPALIFFGLTPLAANITSTVALFPGQFAAGVAARKWVTGAGSLPFWALFVISLTGGAVGGVLLLNTPSKLFAHLVPWLVLFATGVFAWGSFFRKSSEAAVHIGPVRTSLAQFLIAIYGGYFGGGIGFLMMAALTMAGVPTRNAAAIKNVLATVMNASAVLIFLTSPQLHWTAAIIVGVGATLGGVVGSWALRKIDERALRISIVCIGVFLTVGLFAKPL
jgi:uncharacterized membrane protein YfcA